MKGGPVKSHTGGTGEYRRRLVKPADLQIHGFFLGDDQSKLKTKKNQEDIRRQILDYDKMSQSTNSQRGGALNPGTFREEDLARVIADPYQTRGDILSTKVKIVS